MCVRAVETSEFPCPESIRFYFQPGNGSGFTRLKVTLDLVAPLALLCTGPSGSFAL
jgi:hypothetical protein